MIHYRPSIDSVYGYFPFDETLTFSHKHCHISFRNTYEGFSDIMIKMTSLHPCVNVTASLCTSVSYNWLGGAQVAQTFTFCKLFQKTIRKRLKMFL